MKNGSPLPFPQKKCSGEKVWVVAKADFLHFPPSPTRLQIYADRHDERGESKILNYKKKKKEEVRGKNRYILKKLRNEFVIICKGLIRYCARLSPFHLDEQRRIH